MKEELKRPSPELVRDYVSKFNQNSDLIVTEMVLSELFGKYSSNQNLRDILIKVTALNSLYNTNIYATIKVAEHILNKNIDVKLQQGLPEVVDEIAEIEIDGKIRRNFSFASKYCHWHQPEMYPIYDS